MSGDPGKARLADTASGCADPQFPHIHKLININIFIFYCKFACRQPKQLKNGKTGSTCQTPRMLAECGRALEDAAVPPRGKAPAIMMLTMAFTGDQFYNERMKMA